MYGARLSTAKFAACVSFAVALSRLACGRSGIVCVMVAVSSMESVISCSGAFDLLTSGLVKLE